MIDAHVHFWRYARATHGWIDASMEALARDFLPGDLEPLLARAGVERCVAVQAAQTLDETRFLLELARRHASIAGVVGWVDLVDPRVDEVLERLLDEERDAPLGPRTTGAVDGHGAASATDSAIAASARDASDSTQARIAAGRGTSASLAPSKMDRALVGMRHLAQDEPDPRFLLRANVLRGIAAVGARGLAYDVLVRPPQWDAALALARALPDVRFVLDHLGKPPIASGELAAWRAWIAAIAREPNVVAKISGLVTEADPRRAQDDAIAGCIDTALAAFGPSRLMLGSDWPVALLAARQGDALELARSRLGVLSTDERADVEARTAARVYGLAASA